MTNFASSRGASEVKWLESNGEQKNQRDPLAWTAPEQASRPQACVEGASRSMRSRTRWRAARGAAEWRARAGLAQAAEGPAPYSAAWQHEAKEAAGPRSAMDGSCSGQAPMAGLRGWDGEEEGG